jgi:hypothetical protein
MWAGACVCVQNGAQSPTSPTNFHGHTQHYGQACGITKPPDMANMLTKVQNRSSLQSFKLLLVQYAMQAAWLEFVRLRDNPAAHY